HATCSLSLHAALPIFRIRVAPAGITHRAVVDQVGRSVGTEPERRWPVNSVQPSGERLIDLDLAGGTAVRIIAVGTLRTVEGEARSEEHTSELQSLAYL